ncbi:MAG TPA: sulfotransferase, partial [Anaerolineales bacterium]|nr:sulfotransferase [Anaerolineales bacterium]
MKPIMVTGSPRSGTSWTGRIVSQSPFIRYVHEPFNIGGRPCHCGIKFDSWFYYLSRKNRRLFDQHLNHTIFPAFSRIALVNLISEISQTRRIRPLFKYLQSYLPHRVLLKAPFALFSTEALADNFRMDVIVLIRHPAAVVNSYKALNWSHPFSHFLSQAELMDDHLFPFRMEIEDFSKNEYDIVDQISLLWKLIHFMIHKFQKTHSDWVFVRHEDLALEPIEGFRTIFRRINLPFTRYTEAVIRAHNIGNPQSNTTHPYAIKQNGNQVVSKWKKALTSDEIYRIQRMVEPVSSEFYSEQDWN